MRGGLATLVILLLVACSGQELSGQWPDTTFDRTVLERVSLDKRIVIIEQVPRFLVPGQGSSINVDASFDHYLFWDFCRGPGLVWQMIALRPDSRAGSGWSYTRTRTTPAKGNREADTRVTQGYVRGAVAGYAALKKAGLAFFEPGEIKCDAKYGDPLGT